MSRLIPGQVYTATAPDIFGNPNTNTYLLCDIHSNDEVTGERLDEPNCLFIVWQGGMMSRDLIPASRAEEMALAVKTAGLTQRQMTHLASLAFREWQGRECPQTVAHLSR